MRRLASASRSGLCSSPEIESFLACPSVARPNATEAPPHRTLRTAEGGQCHLLYHNRMQGRWAGRHCSPQLPATLLTARCMELLISSVGDQFCGVPSSCRATGLWQWHWDPLHRETKGSRGAPPHRDSRAEGWTDRGLC